MLRRLGETDLYVSPVALGCWPIAGMTSVDVNEEDSLRTLHAALDAGINFFDTAYGYGRHGESERLIAQVLSNDRDRVVLATKGGMHWDDQGQRVLCARPETLRRECDQSLQRLNTTHVDLLYLHAPDPNVPVGESAGMLKSLLDEGKTRAVGASNLDTEQLEQFAAECPLAAVQPPYNMLQREIERDILPWCRRHGTAAVVYWPLMKGLLAGKLRRDHEFAAGDSRANYPMFQGEQWQRNQDFVDRLREIAAVHRRTVAQLVVAWTIGREAITAALCGAKRAYQIEETAVAMQWQLDEQTRAKIDQAIEEREAREER